MSDSKIVYFEHQELGTLEVLVTGVKDLATMRVYYGAYDVTRDLSEEDRLKIIKQVSEDTWKK